MPANQDGSCPLKHLSEIKIIVENDRGELFERLSPWAHYVTQPENQITEGTTYKQRVYHPEADKVDLFILHKSRILLYKSKNNYLSIHI